MKFPAFPEKVQRVVVNIKIEDIAHHALDLLNSWIAKLKYILAVLADQVVMLFI